MKPVKSAQSLTSKPLQVSHFYNIILVLVVIISTLLLICTLIPPQIWTRLFPATANASLNGPFPASIAPIITVVIYLCPTITGYLCRNWQKALLLATLPAWIALGIFLIAATSRMGAFYIVSTERVTANVSVLELFAALGGMGWLARSVFKLR